MSRFSDVGYTSFRPPPTVTTISTPCTTSAVAITITNPSK